MTEITVGIKTFLRPDALACSLEALRAFNFAEVIVADDNPASIRNEYEEVYTRYQALLPLRVLFLPYDTGVSVSRNSIVNNTKTEFLLILDDDQVINKTVSSMHDVLTSRRELGGVSCFFNENMSMRCTACGIHYDGGHIVKELREIPDVHTTDKGTKYSLFDFIPSATLFRLSCLKDVTWDPFYKTGAEHLDFYIRHKQLGKWDFAVALDAYIDHIRYDDEKYNTPAYREHREGLKLKESWKYFNAKFDVLGKIEGTKLSDMLAAPHLP